MRVVVNDEEREVAEGVSLYDLAEELGLNPKLVVAQHNDDIVRPAALRDVTLQDADRVDFVHFVGGG